MTDRRTENQYRDHCKRDRRNTHKRNTAAFRILAPVRQRGDQRICDRIENTADKCNQSQNSQDAADHQTGRDIKLRSGFH